MDNTTEGRTGAFNDGADSNPGKFGTDATDMAPSPAAAFTEFAGYGNDFGQNFVHDTSTERHDHGQPLNEAQFPQQPVSGPQRRPKGQTATDRHSGRYNAAVTSASGTALGRPYLNEYEGYT